MFDRYYCIKTENICYISHYFLHYFVLLFPRCCADSICTDYARSRAGQYKPRGDSNSVARYEHIESCIALHQQRVNCLLMHDFLQVNARLLITCDTAFYAIIIFVLTCCCFSLVQLQMFAVWDISYLMSVTALF